MTDLEKARLAWRAVHPSIRAHIISTITLEDPSDEDRIAAALLAAEAEAPADCPCEGESDEPGPHIDGCAFIAAVEKDPAEENPFRDPPAPPLVFEYVDGGPPFRPRRCAINIPPEVPRGQRAIFLRALAKWIEREARLVDTGREDVKALGKHKITDEACFRLAKRLDLGMPAARAALEDALNHVAHQTPLEAAAAAVRLACTTRLPKKDDFAAWAAVAQAAVDAFGPPKRAVTHEEFLAAVEAAASARERHDGYWPGVVASVLEIVGVEVEAGEKR